jgi:hypothetical protein
LLFFLLFTRQFRALLLDIVKVPGAPSADDDEDDNSDCDKANDTDGNADACLGAAGEFSPCEVLRCNSCHVCERSRPQCRHVDVIREKSFRKGRRLVGNPISRERMREKRCAEVVSGQVSVGSRLKIGI